MLWYVEKWEAQSQGEEEEMNWFRSLWERRRFWKSQSRDAIALQERELAQLKARMEVSQNRLFLEWLDDLCLADIESAILQDDYTFFLRRAKFIRFIIEEITSATQEKYDIAKENLERKK